jgi:hypothetical protein
VTELLRGCRAKFQRSGELLKGFSSEIEKFATSTPLPYQTSAYLLDDGLSYIFEARMLEPVPDRFSVLAGEIVHHLASGLDHLFCALVIRNGMKVRRNHYFPIFTKKDHFERECANGLLDDVSRSTSDLIRSMQPCYQLPQPELTVLAALKSFNNTDKHRLLNVAGGAGNLGQNIVIGSGVAKSGRLPGVVGFGNPAFVRLGKKSVEYFRINFGEPMRHIEATADFSFEIVFEEIAGAENLLAVKLLSGLRQGVEHTVRMFEGELGEQL